MNLTEPNPVNYDSVVDQANKLYWGKSMLRNGADGHFIRTSLCLKSWMVFKTSVKPKLPFMMLTQEYLMLIEYFQ